MEKKLRRDNRDKMIGGVASGIANYFQLDVTWVRVAFALASIFGGSGLWVYLILWIAVPKEKVSAYNYTDYRSDKEPIAESLAARNKSSVNFIVGLMLVVGGVYFLLMEFDMLPYWFEFRKLWPIVVIAIGLTILLKAKEIRGADEITDIDEIIDTEEFRKSEDVSADGSTDKTKEPLI